MRRKMETAAQLVRDAIDAHCVGSNLPRITRGQALIRMAWLDTTIAGKAMQQQGVEIVIQDPAVDAPAIERIARATISGITTMPEMIPLSIIHRERRKPIRHTTVAQQIAMGLRARGISSRQVSCRMTGGCAVAVTVNDPSVNRRIVTDLAMRHHHPIRDRSGDFLSSAFFVTVTFPDEAITESAERGAAENHPGREMAMEIDRMLDHCHSIIHAHTDEDGRVDRETLLADLRSECEIVSMPDADAFIANHERACQEVAR